MWNLGEVFTSGGVFPTGTDPYYHLRRIHLALENGFVLPHRDLFCHFPEGVVDPWPPLFDWFIAAVVWVAGGGSPSTDTLLTVAVVTPPVLGAIVVLCLYALGRRLVVRTPALVAAWVYAAMPAALYRAQVGTVDHHVAESLLALAIYTMVSRAIAGKGPSWLQAIGLGLTLGAACLTWLGALIFVGLACFYLLLVVVLRVGERMGREVARFTMAAFGLGGLLVLPAALSTVPGRAGEFRSYHLSLLQPVLLLGLAGVAAGLYLLAPWCRKGRRPRLRGIGALAGLGLLGVSVLVITGAGPGLLEGFAFARQATPTLLLPLESRPLLFPQGVFSLDMMWLLFTTSTLCAAVGWLLLLRRRPVRLEPLLFLGLLFLSHLVLAFAQARFTHYLAADLALLSGCFGTWLFRVAGRAIGVIGTGLVLVLPGFLIGVQKFKPSPPPPQIREALIQLEKTSPPVSPETPEYGVVANWDLGHWINWLAKRPCLDSTFLHLTPFKTTAAFFMASTEEEADTVADTAFIRYAVSVPIPPSGSGKGQERCGVYGYLYPRQYMHVLGLVESRYLEMAERGLGITPAFSRTLLFRLHYLDGVQPFDRCHPDFPALGQEMFAGETLRTWRLHITADHPLHPGDANRVKIFERVEGAILSGELVPRARIRVWAEIHTPLGEAHAFLYADRVRADEAGRYSIRVPYWERSRKEEVGIVNGYRVEAPAIRWQRSVRVTEAAVRTGMRIVVP